MRGSLVSLALPHASEGRETGTEAFLQQSSRAVCIFSLSNVLLVCSSALAQAPQSPEIAELSVTGTSAAAASLPDSPGAVASSSSSTAVEPQIANQKEGSQPSLNPLQRLAQPAVPRPTDITVAPGQIGPAQTVRDKFVSSFKDSVSPFSLAGEVISGGYSHVTNGIPNYGTDSTAFGKRVGASVARGTSQKILSEGLFASVLHEDPRYYQLGSKQNFPKRVVYAATRVLITRTDAGKSTPNLALIGGYLGAAGLAETYYPSANHNTADVLSTWGSGVGGAALGNEITEFLPDVLQFLRLKKVSHP